MNAYRKYALSKNLSFEILDDDDNGHLVVKIQGHGAGKAFKREQGKHIVQRIPPTETKGRKQTSVIGVIVLPLPPDNTVKPLPMNELEVTAQTGRQKAGGQNVNKVASAIRAVHVPTGISVFINGRDQGQNKKEALRILTAKVNDLRNGQENASYSDLRKQQWDGGGRGNKIRTYNFLENRAVDHRFGIKVKNVKMIIEKGRFELLIKN